MEAATAPRNEQLTFEVGGREPTGSALTVTGVKLEDVAQYEKGQVVELRVVCEIGEVAFRDKHDSVTGQVVDCIRAHKGRATSVSVVRVLDLAD